MATKTSLLGLTKPAYTDAADIAVLNGNFDLIDKAVGQGARVGNLLDNSFFPSAFVINQRGQTVYHDGYGIDRWRTWNSDATVTLTADGIKGDGTEASVLYQVIETHKVKAGKAYTIAVGYSDGTVSCASGVLTKGSGIGLWDSVEQAFLLWGGDPPSVRLWHATKTIQWVALYEGAYTAETLPAYVYKGYAAELAECQRYFERLPLNLMMDNTDKLVIMDRTRVVKRIYPTTIANATDSSESGASVAFWDSNGDFIRGVIEFSTTGNQYWYGYLDISADL